ncbi:MULTISPECIES: TIGR04083 family peptide-modifying radical SAM enzyme [Methanobacterium]|uniref:Putative peptide-modifying radical SAM enzyme n=1 Tax=Methanobacterium subterraneum TaxID=59277 RepID=A0A2H4VF10_9EURY|nr:MULTISPECIES: TIGR04083 family peptide-modifying radical SAM enzyme [Methanobacterium]MBW4257109.1 TIGR04083 family peptide-modifying radical SAM enzyme [Methanobacterium sp. YSL]PKL73530.1 MAG: TIGR04083 family peptide-modifying radical SAM enzyme [Methanobacteriales archaeon HGW-Methanobacteriales-2]AUB56671.1 putative peptide-modifying radical SAM enzyme [Methanobacterium subterraneum]AUB59166.1 putative peptide-modifying radical SAM enzyme [Methanobacterium sp. MZ-A1]AUB59437.1 putative
MAFHVMLVPTLGCPSDCKYCWSSEEGSPVMGVDIIKETVEWLKNFREEPVTFTFHGGEPLLAGYDFFLEALPLLANELSHLKPAFALQTNLWNMTPELARLFKEYNIPIGSSLDGPEELNDLQRGKGYYQRTMKGYEIAREEDLQVSFISTFTSYSIQYKEDIFNFFLENGLNLKLHPALPSLRDENPEKWALSSEEYGELLIYLLDQYLEHMDEIELKNIDHLCKCVFIRRGVVCTFVDCMGDTFAVGPDGSIYPCYRFVGMPEYVMGNVQDHPSMDDLAQSDAWKLLHDFKDYVDTECKKCSYIKFCRGGCPYNALSINEKTGKAEINGVDPHCTAYKMIFKEITKRATKEMLGSGMGMIQGVSDNNPQTKRGIMSIMLKQS